MTRTTIQMLVVALPILPGCLRSSAQQQNIPPAGSNRGFYVPVQPRTPQSGPPCGHYGTAPCAVAVEAPPGATGEQLFALGLAAGQRRQQETAAAWYEKSAEAGYVRGQAAIGIAYVNGTGVARDYTRAVYWLELASQQGSRGAQSNLADLYESGEGGVALNEARAIVLLRASAAQRYGPAEMSLGLDYEYGRGVPHNRATAIQLLRRAAADGADYAGLYASTLEHAPAAPFRDEQALASYAHPKPKPGPPGSCPAFATYLTGPIMQMRINLFCQAHPGCPYSMPGFPNSSCPR